ncbi:glucose-1-phosphate cytidylyltransferase [Azospirillum sp. B21]|uniref:glucose-1-phosphate cytidylyltransferase n=1 Tax=Azospirillum sp. B21 TaxID=2607496 RepID=UPI001B3BF53D|nr:glucose-1-phosphate cytidylyltransferase [Azospirillum sp. B21]
MAAGLEAVILCGGLGTRLREETEFKPKPMVEIGGQPILWHIMKFYRHFGVRRFLLCLGYKGDVIRDYFLNYRNRTSDIAIDIASGTVTRLAANTPEEDWEVVLVETGARAETGLRIQQALKYIQGDRFFATYGDGVCDVDIGTVFEHHRSLGKLATVCAVHPSSRFGELGLSGDIVHAFAEKPQVTDGWINGGFFVFEKRAFQLFDPTADVSLESGVLEKLAAMKELAVFRHDGFWQCMDTFRETQLLNSLWLENRAPWRLWDREPGEKRGAEVLGPKR